MSNLDDLDSFDKKILAVLQLDSDISMNDLGNKVGLSHTPCWRRVKRLQDQGYIRAKVMLLDPQKINLGVNVHAYITIKKHDEQSLVAFESAVQHVPEIVECYSITGDKDYILHIVARDVDHYENLLKKTLVHLPNVASVNSAFALKQIKYTTALPLL